MIPVNEQGKISPSYTNKDVKGLGLSEPSIQVSRQSVNTRKDEKIIYRRGSALNVEKIKKKIKSPFQTILNSLHDNRVDSVINSIAIYLPPDNCNGYVVTCSNNDSNACVWNLATSELQHMLTTDNEEGLTCVTICPPIVVGGHPLVIAGSTDCCAYVWDLSTALLVFTLANEHADVISSVAYYTPKKGSGTTSSLSSISAKMFGSSKEEPSLAITGSFDCTVVFWDLLDGSKLRILEGGHNDQITSLAVLNWNNDPLIITGSSDNTAIAWDLHTGEYLKTFKDCHTDEVTSVGIYLSQNLNKPPLIVTGGLDGKIIMWDLKTCIPLRIIDVHQEVEYIAVTSSSSDTPQVIVVTSDDSAVLWDLAHGTIVRSLVTSSDNDKSLRTVGGNSIANNITAVSLATKEDNTVIIVTGSRDGTSLVWNMETEHEMPYYAIKFEGIQKSRFTKIAISPEIHDKDSLVVTSSSEKVTVWELDTGRVLYHLEGKHKGEVNDVAFCHWLGDMKNVMVITASSDRTLWIWNLFTGEAVKCLNNGHTSEVTCVCVYNPYDNENNPLAISGGNDKVCIVWDIIEGYQMMKVNLDNRVSTICLHVPNNVHQSGPTLTSLRAWHTSAPLVIVGCGNNLQLWNLTTGKILRKIENGHSDVVTSVAVCNPFSGAPIIVTGSKDQNAVVWNMMSGEIIKKLNNGHKDSITSVGIHSAPDGSLLLVFTGSLDGTVQVWDLKNTGILMKLEGIGIDNGVVALANFSFAHDNHRLPFILTCSKDKIITLWNLFPPDTFMPVKATVKKQFELDLKESHKNATYHRLNNLSNKFKEPLWIENNYLFIFAIQRERTDFLVKFLIYLRIVIKFVGIKECVTMIHLCLERQADDKALQIILDCWISVLNLPAIDAADQIFYHAMFFLQIKDLIYLSKEHPQKFSKFICSIKLVKSDSCVNVEDVNYHIDLKSKFLIRGCKISSIFDIWGRPSSFYNMLDEIQRVLDSTRSDEAPPVTPLFLPLLHAADIELLEAMVLVSNTLENVSLFESDVGIYALNFAWSTYGRNWHLISMGKYAAFVAVFSLSGFSYELLTNCTSEYQLRCEYLSYTLNFLVLLGVAVFISEEFAQMKLHKTGFLSHFFRDIWNFIDLCIIVFSGSGVLFRIYYESENYYSRCALCVASLVVWLKLLFFLQPFDNVGPIVSLIYRLTYEIKDFFTILFIVIFAFAQAFWFMSAPDETLDFGTHSGSFYYTYLYMLGGFQSDFSHTYSPTLSIVMLVVFLFVTVIILLNFLIAFMSDKFVKIGQSRMANWRKEQASYILEDKLLSSSGIGNFACFKSKFGNRKMVAPCLHILKTSVDYEISLLQAIPVENRVLNLINEQKSDSNSELGFLQDDKMIQFMEAMSNKNNKLEEKIEELNNKLNMQSIMRNFEKSIEDVIDKKLDVTSILSVLEKKLKGPGLNIDQVSNLLDHRIALLSKDIHDKLLNNTLSDSNNNNDSNDLLNKISLLIDKKLEIQLAEISVEITTQLDEKLSSQFGEIDSKISFLSIEIDGSLDNKLGVLMDQSTNRFNDIEDKLKSTDKNIKSMNGNPNKDAKTNDIASNLLVHNSNINGDILGEIKDLSDKISDFEIKNDQALSQMERRLRYNIEKNNKGNNSSTIVDESLTDEFNKGEEPKQGVIKSRKKLGSKISGNSQDSTARASIIANMTFERNSD